MAFAYRLKDHDSGAVAVVPMALACCSVELASALDSGAFVALEPTEPRLGHVLLIVGTVTQVMSATVRDMWEELPEPKAAVAFGACASSGGPYWDAPTVRPGADSDVPIARYVLGCPPRPADLVDAVRQVSAAWT